MSFYSELKRRGVLQVGAAYLVFWWLLIQVASTLLPVFDVPTTVMRGLTVMGLAGFPICLILAWIFDLTPQGIQKTGKDTSTVAARAFPVKSLNYIIIGFLTAAVVLFSLDKFLWKTKLGPDTDAGIILAVLPFLNMSGDQANEPFTMGIHDDVLTQLSKIHAFKTISRTSVAPYRDSVLAIPDIADKLGATTVLEGGVQRSEDRIRINAQLIEAKADTHLWAETYDRQLTAANIFAIQSEISKAIASALKMTLSPSEQASLEQVPTTNLAAYDAYTTARASMDSTASGDLEESVLKFSEAIQLDQEFAAAWAGLCEAYLAQYRKNSDGAVFDSAESACNQALELDNTRIEVHIALGGLYRAHGDLSSAEAALQQTHFARAEQALETALDLDDRLLDAQVELAFVNASQGRLEEAENRLHNMAKTNPAQWLIQSALFSFYYGYSDMAGHYELAEHHANNAAQLRPDLASAWNNLGSANYMLGRYDVAAVAWQKSMQIEPSRTGYTNSGLAYYNAGQFDKAVEMQLKATELAPNDHRVWGRLADALRHRGGDDAMTQTYYQKANDLAAQKLLVNDQDWRTLQMQATYVAYAGRAEEAVELTRKSLLLANRRPESLLFAALVYLQNGDTETSLALLREMVDKDESYRLFIKTDPDLVAISAVERL